LAGVAQGVRAAVPFRVAFLPLALAAAAFAALTAWGLSSSAHLMMLLPDGTHEMPGMVMPGDAGAPVLAAAFLGAWMLMVLATMLPTALPLLGAFERVAASRPRPGRLGMLVTGGFLAVWLTAGIVLAGIDVAVHRFVSATGPFYRPWLVPALVLALAGAYQLSPLARRCLTACRVPFSFIARRWTGLPGAHRQAWAIGVDYGRSCLGCCASLMAVMVVVGMVSPLWILGLGLLGALQKHAPGGQRLATATGVGLLVLAAVVAFLRLPMGAG
jgi:predicted metal-binding membrane protein